MNKHSKAIPLALGAVALAALVGCSSNPTHESAGQYVDDTVITSRVKAALFNEPTLNSAEINVETFKGRVQLSGFVSSHEREATAMNVARNVPGVLEVKDDMRLK
jgi:osmotically-inducible protein OsmY